MQPRSDKALLAAITAAVTSYIKTQDQNLMPAAVFPVVSPPPAAASLYSASGRLQMMESTRLLCLRLGRR